MLCLAAALSPSTTPAADRIVLLESFVNDDCLGCLTFNAQLERLGLERPRHEHVVLDLELTDAHVEAVQVLVDLALLNACHGIPPLQRISLALSLPQI